MTNKTLTGLEAVLLMQEGGYVTDGQHIYRFVNTKIEASDITSFNKGKPEWKSGNVFNFNYDQYKEYTQPKPLTGWERASNKHDEYFCIGHCGDVRPYSDDFLGYDRRTIYNIANYFSTEEKAEEINLKQTLFRKLQRFSDENGGNEIDWCNNKQNKYYVYCDYTRELKVGSLTRERDFGQVYFISEEVVHQAIFLFKEDLIKYFTM
uniref:Uncharacterized protein n=1 Tax=Siphoviridae sp. ctqSm5 TaxID=2827949 RepID=A0A8S5SP17_9CAUD|nr:MAG TPA: hypothetical protein [Siphoviridae sp. ctqSm5]